STATRACFAQLDRRQRDGGKDGQKASRRLPSKAGGCKMSRLLYSRRQEHIHPSLPDRSRGHPRCLRWIRLTRDGPPFVVAQVLDRGAVIAHQAMRSPSRRTAAARSRAFERRLWFVGSDRPCRTVRILETRREWRSQWSLNENGPAPISPALGSAEVVRCNNR